MIGSKLRRMPSPVTKRTGTSSVPLLSTSCLDRSYKSGLPAQPHDLLSNAPTLTWDLMDCYVLNSWSHTGRASVIFMVDIERVSTHLYPQTHCEAHELS